MSYPTYPIEDLYCALKTYMATRPRVFRSHPLGAPGSAARAQQAAEIAAEDKLLVAIASCESTMPGQNKAGRI
jgi:hypothetical protein